MTERSIFLAALDIPDPAARAAYLDQACRGDPALRRGVEGLLAAHAGPGSLLDRPAPGVVPPAPTTGVPSDPGRTAAHDPAGPGGGGYPAGTVLAGRYVLGEVLGEGGMGVVYRAEQVAPVKRPVAVKLVNPGMDSRAVLARFEAERQALAVMDHPGIAKVLDAGAAPDGRPFFVMELVNGVPLTEYCDARKLTVPQRLELFQQVCAAVQHAHQKGVIHRDLKPSNILVEEADGRPVPKVIDFGLAKATGGNPLTDTPLSTAFGAVLGTPLYMAPEQAGGAPDVDTRADVYALGAVLYELLTGSTPIRRDTLKEAAVQELLRVIREEEPPAPSSRLNTLDALPSVAAARGTEPARLGRVVRGDLDWVVMRCLEKDRARRYESAAALAADVDRFLHHEPVAAGPPSALYRVRKFARRNRAAVTAAGLVLAALVAGVAGTTWGLVEARRQAGIARQAADDERDARTAEAAQRRRADAEAAVAREVNDILTRGLIHQANPTVQIDAGFRPDPDLKVRTLLDRVAAGLDGRFPDRPAVEAEVRRTVGRAYTALGVYPAAVRHLERALELARRAAPAAPDGAEADLAAADAADNLVTAYTRANRLADADRLGREFLARLEPAVGPDDPRVLAACYSLGLVASRLDRREEAQRLLGRTLAGWEKAFGPDGPAAARARHALGVEFAAAGDAARALDHLSRTLEAYRRLAGEDDTDTMMMAHNVAALQLKAGRAGEAVETFRRLVDAAGRALGPTHPHTLAYRNGLAQSYVVLGRPDLAEPHQRAAADAARAALPPDHPDAVDYGYNLGVLYKTLGRLADADRELPAALASSRRAYPPGHPVTNVAAQDLYEVRFATDRPPEAEPLVRELLAVYEPLDPDGWVIALLRALLGRAALEQGRQAEAEPLLLAGYRGMKAQAEAIAPRYRLVLPETADRLVEVYVALNKPEEAKRWRAERAKYPFVAPPPRPKD